MKNNKLQPLSANGLDQLLKQAFLSQDFDQAKNQQMLELVSNQVMNAAVSPLVWLKKAVLNKLFLFMLTAALIGGFIYLTQPFENHQLQQLPVKNISLVKAKVAIKEDKTSKIVNSAKQDTVEKTPNRNISLTEAHKTQITPQEPQTDNVAIEVQDSFKKAIVPAYVFPVLTEKEKKANEKEKKRMAKMAAKLSQDKSKDKYAFIPAPADNSVGSFYMQSGEVTNIEYRTFLFDLLIHEKKEEFLRAKPQQDLWINAGGVHFFDTLSRIYFSDKKYNVFPVVNIPVAGAEMYCEWLTGLANDIRRKENKPELQFRLPYDNEWLYAASVGHAEAQYPWFTNSIQNQQNRFLADFCIQKLSDQFMEPVVYPGKTDRQAYTSAGMVLCNRQLATIDVWSYNPNDFFIYGVCGNASEMVYADNTKKIKTRGGNWNSDFKHLKFSSEDEFKINPEPSPMIGFRVGAFIKK